MPDKTEGYKEYVSIVVESAYFGGGKKESDDAPRARKKSAEEYGQERIENTSESRFAELNGDEPLPFD